MLRFHVSFPEGKPFHSLPFVGSSPFKQVLKRIAFMRWHDRRNINSSCGAWCISAAFRRPSGETFLTGDLWHDLKGCLQPYMAHDMQNKSLTVRPWQLVVGRRLFPFGKAYLQGLCQTSGGYSKEIGLIDASQSLRLRILCGHQGK